MTDSNTNTSNLNNSLNLELSTHNGLILFHKPELSVRSFRMLRKGCAGWLADTVCYDIMQTAVDPDSARQQVVNTGMLPDKTQVDPAYLTHDFDATFVGAVKYENMKLGKFAARDYFDVFCINHSPSSLLDDGRFVTMMSFLSPIATHNDPIELLIQRRAIQYARRSILGEQEMSLAESLVQPTRFTLRRSKTSYGVIAFLQTESCQSDEETKAMYNRFGVEWVKANGGLLPQNYSPVGTAVNQNQDDTEDLVF